MTVQLLTLSKSVQRDQLIKVESLKLLNGSRVFSFINLFLFFVFILMVGVFVMQSNHITSSLVLVDSINKTIYELQSPTARVAQGSISVNEIKSKLNMLEVETFKAINLGADAFAANAQDALKRY